jgi:AraC family chemosensory pili system transcriptional regulator ChpD
MFNWSRGGSYCAPLLWFYASVTPKIRSITLRIEGRRSASDGSGILVGLPDDLCIVERIDGGEIAAGERTLMSLAIPREAVDEDLWLVLSRSVRSGMLHCPRAGRTLAALDSAMRDLDEHACMRCEELLLAFLTLVVPHTARPSRKSPHPHSRVVAQARAYIHSHWREPLSLSSIAEDIGVTKWHLSRSFSRELGLTPGSYLRSVRAGQALGALRGGAKPMSVASEMGYSDQSHLTRDMRRVYGLTPGAYQSA